MGQIAVITGASAGVGRATALAFAQRGFDVALLARGQAGLEAAAWEVESAGVRALIIPTDVAQFDQVDRAATRVEEDWGPIDVWVNDAMTTVFAPAWEFTPADFQRAVPQFDWCESVFDVHPPAGGQGLPGGLEHDQGQEAPTVMLDFVERSRT